VTGAGFPFYVGDGARVIRALLQFFLDEDVKAGYTEVAPPILVNAASATATGQLPDKEGQMYETTPDHLYAVPTAEVPLTNFSAMKSWMRPRCRSTAARTRRVSAARRAAMARTCAG
jgi:seryl-tRNA synthetase